MIVRILNKVSQRDRYFDCKNSEICPERNGPDGEIIQFFLVLGFENGEDIQIVLLEHDKLYYMNDTGKTIGTDIRYWPTLKTDTVEANSI